MRFMIEVGRVGPDDSYTALHRSPHDSISPKLVKSAAQQRLSAHTARGANSVKIFNAQGEEIYSWRCDQNPSPQEIQPSRP